jgi:hypothetical protein
MYSSAEAIPRVAGNEIASPPGQGIADSWGFGGSQGHGYVIARRMYSSAEATPKAAGNEIASPPGQAAHVMVESPQPRTKRRPYGQ